MAKNKRQEQILEILRTEGFAGVNDLGVRLFASLPTIRRDLDILEKSGLVRRSHGGAVLASDAVSTPVSYRRGKRVHEKLRMARLAATLLERDQLIFTDASSTALYLSEHIKESDHISVVTNGIPMCQMLAKQNITVYCTGGRLLVEPLGFVGGTAERMITHYCADLFFFSSASLNAEGLISDYSEEENDLRLAMFERCRKSVYMCDSAKFNRTSAYCLFEIGKADYVVTDIPLPEDMRISQGFRLLREGEGAFLYEKDV